MCEQTLFGVDSTLHVAVQTANGLFPLPLRLCSHCLFRVSFVRVEARRGERVAFAVRDCVSDQSQLSAELQVSRADPCSGPVNDGMQCNLYRLSLLRVMGVKAERQSAGSDHCDRLLEI